MAHYQKFLTLLLYNFQAMTFDLLLLSLNFHTYQMILYQLSAFSAFLESLMSLDLHSLYDMFFNFAFGRAALAE